MKKGACCLAIGLALLLAAPVLAQEHGGGGGGGCGDVFGDLIHVLRDAVTGQPILAQRWVEMPAELPGYGWGYCPIPVDALGNPLGFAPLSCEVALADAARVVELDYFGRLSGGRTKERNSRMHFNEVISTIKMADGVGIDETGRLATGYDCSTNANGYVVTCNEWAVVDSPMESLALYTRLMKYGHLQTDPLEVDIWFHGDPALPTQYNPALGPEDWLKFLPQVRHLLPASEAANCFGDGYLNGFNPICAAPVSLDSKDFTAAGAYLGGAASKTGKITGDLVQYTNRILKITKTTEASQATTDTLPALVRDCWSSASDPVLRVDPVTGEVIPEDPVYDATCATAAAATTLPNYAHFPDVQELFVDFEKAAYNRPETRDRELYILVPLGFPLWQETANVPLLAWLQFINGTPTPLVNLDAFVAASSDTLRSIEFVHNYRVPENLGWNFVY